MLNLSRSEDLYRDSLVFIQDILMNRVAEMRVRVDNVSWSDDGLGDDLMRSDILVLD